MYTIESCDASYKCTGVCTQSQFINSLSDFCAAVPQSMLYSIALLFFLASMQLGNLQEEQPTPVGGNDSMYNVLCNLANTVFHTIRVEWSLFHILSHISSMLCAIGMRYISK